MAIGAADNQVHAGRASLDAAADYLRNHGARVTAWYLLAAGPVLIACWWWIAAVAMENRSQLPPASLALLGAMLWRWGVLAKIQQVVMRDLGMAADRLGFKMILIAIAGRLLAHVGILWGSLLIVPGLWSFYVSSFISPALLTPGRPAGSSLRHTVALSINQSILLARHASMLTLLVTVAMLAFGVLQGVMVYIILPSLMGYDTADLKISMGNLSWWLFSMLAVLLVFDCYWAVGSVMLLQQLEARRTGSDLQARLMQMQEAA